MFLEASSVEELCEAIARWRSGALLLWASPGPWGWRWRLIGARTPARAAASLIATRPTAVNLRWGVERALAADDPLREALAIAAEDSERNRALGRLGAELLPPGCRVLTHCNAWFAGLRRVRNGPGRDQIRPRVR